MKIFHYLVATSALLSLSALSPQIHAQLTMSQEATRTAVVDALCPTCVTADLYPSPYAEQTLPGIQEALSYVGFDLAALLPEGAVITSATLDVFDLNTEVDDQFLYVALMDVPSDWDPETLTLDEAKKRYDAVTSTKPSPLVRPNTRRALWQGEVAMDLEFAPGQSTAKRAIVRSAGSSSDEDLVDALNMALSEGDGFASFGFYGKTLDDNAIVGIDFGDGEAGPTLTLKLAGGGDAGKTVIYDFDGGDAAGWEAVLESATEGGPNHLGLIHAEDPNVGDSVPPQPLTGAAFVGPIPFESEDGTNARDQAHQTLVYRSPEFIMGLNGRISFALIGGAKPNLDLEEVNANGLQEDSSTDGAIGVALRHADSGQYISFHARSEDGSQAWETIVLDANTLEPLIEPGQAYTLDFIDSFHGGWGWAGLDNVIIQQGVRTTQFDFDDETLQGWTVVQGSEEATGPHRLDVISQNDPTVGNSVPPTPLNAPAFVGPVPFEAADGTNTRDQSHKTLVLRSPPFSIYPNGMISFALIGGAHAGLDLDAVNADGLPEVSSGSGAIGVALRQVSNGAYLTFNARSESGSQAWETIILDQEDLRGVVAFGETYTLDFIDTHSGGWGWAGLDDVIIQEGTPILKYNFDDETLQGWTQEGISETGPTQLGVISVNDPTVGDSVPPVPLNAPAFVGPLPFEDPDGGNTRDQAHATLVLRSPPFSLFGDGEISFALIGGAHTTFDLEEVNANGLPEASGGGGAIGVALRDDQTGHYLAFYGRSESGSQSWETIILTSEDLAGVIDEGAQYTLDFIDSHSGGWGWAGLDDVIIRPGMAPETGGSIVSVGLEGGQIVVEYTGQLQQASQVEGPWLPVEGASSPFSEPASQEMQFFRAGP
ncbi:MAG: hypothetical protein HOD39_17915 [Verrucomicrobia bacterium]|nr:hypothetical protein [Verrucomicrobiota bacterium]